MGLEIKDGDSEAKKARKTNRKAKKIRKGEEKADRKKYGRGEDGRKNKMEAIAKEAANRKMNRAEERISSQTAPTGDGASMSCGKPMGGSMYGKKHGSSMSGEKYDAREAYNKNLSASSRLHYLENERHDRTSGHPIHKHMKGFGASMKLKGHGASLPGTPAGSKSKRMTNLGTKAINNKKPQYTDSGQNYKDANNRLVLGSQVDEGELSPVVRKSPMRPYVEGGKDSMYAGEKLFLTKDKGSMMRTGEPLKKMKTGTKVGKQMKTGKKVQRELRSVPGIKRK